MKLLSFSGAATKIASHAAYCSKFKDYKPNIIAGLSSGSLVIYPYLLGKFEELKNKTTTLKLSDIFDKQPVNEKGKLTISSILRGIFTGSFGSMYNTKKMLKRFISRDEFYKLINSYNCPLIYIGVTNVTLNRFELILINDCTYEEMLDYTLASCTIPMYCPPIKIGKCYYVDGGLKHHNPASEVIRLHKDILKNVKSIYSIPEGEDSTPDYGFNGKSLGRMLSKTFDMLQSGVSLENQKTEKDLCKQFNIELEQYFAPKIMKGIYDVNNQRLKELFDKVSQQK